MEGGGPRVVVSTAAFHGSDMVAFQHGTMTNDWVYFIQNRLNKFSTIHHNEEIQSFIFKYYFVFFRRDLGSGSQLKVGKRT